MDEVRKILKFWWIARKAMKSSNVFYLTETLLGIEHKLLRNQG